MHLETVVTIVVPRTIPAINVLFHAMKQWSQAVDVDAVMVVVAVGATVQILGESVVPIRVIVLPVVQIHHWVMESKSKMESGWWIESRADGMRLIRLRSMASGIVISPPSVFLQPMSSGASQEQPLPWRRARPLQQVQVQPLLLFPGGSWVDWLIGI